MGPTSRSSPTPPRRSREQCRTGSAGPGVRQGHHRSGGTFAVSRLLDHLAVGPSPRESRSTRRRTSSPRRRRRTRATRWIGSSSARRRCPTSRGYNRDQGPEHEGLNLRPCSSGAADGTAPPEAAASARVCRGSGRRWLATTSNSSPATRQSAPT